MRTFLAVGFVLASLPVFGQPENVQDPPWLRALITWLPFLFLIGLWIFFIRRSGWVGKGGYREYMRISQEKLVQIESHLADMAKSLRTIAERERT